VLKSFWKKNQMNKRQIKKQNNKHPKWIKYCPKCGTQIFSDENGKFDMDDCVFCKVLDELNETWFSSYIQPLINNMLVDILNWLINIYLRYFLLI
jgi:hypothetical protein